jgi:hypothetical protein
MLAGAALARDGGVDRFGEPCSPRPWPCLVMTDLTCEALVEMPTEHLDGTLDSETQRRVVDHLPTCPGCERLPPSAAVAVSGRARWSDVRSGR